MNLSGYVRGSGEIPFLSRRLQKDSVWCMGPHRDKPGWSVEVCVFTLNPGFTVKSVRGGTLFSMMVDRGAPPLIQGNHFHTYSRSPEYRFRCVSDACELSKVTGWPGALRGVLLQGASPVWEDLSLNPSRSTIHGRNWVLQKSEKNQLIWCLGP